MLSVVEGSRDPAVEVEWDAMPDVAGFEDSQVSNQRLLPSLWNKDKDGGWRMDVEIDLIEDEVDSDSESENEDEGEGESDVEMNDDDDDDCYD